MKHDYKTQLDLENTALMKGAYHTERIRLTRAAQIPESQESPTWEREKMEARKQGIREHITGKRVSQSSITRFKEASERHAKKKR